MEASDSYYSTYTYYNPNTGLETPVSSGYYTGLIDLFDLEITDFESSENYYPPLNQYK